MTSGEKSLMLPVKVLVTCLPLGPKARTLLNCDLTTPSDSRAAFKVNATPTIVSPTRFTI